MDQVKSIITLRSGKVIEKPILEPFEKEDELVTEGKEGVEYEHCKEKIDSPSVLPFPHATTKQRKVNHNSEIFETFKQVRINTTTKQRKVNHNSEIFETFKQVRINIFCWMLLNRYLLMLKF